jgi:transposase-like protein
MNIRNLTPDERYELVLECRRSGLTDHQWLREHGISKSTFYYWISQFRKNGYPAIPEPLKQSVAHKANLQEVVKVNVLPDTMPLKQNDPAPITCSKVDPVIEIISGTTVIRLTNGTDPKLLQIVLSSLGGVV